MVNHTRQLIAKAAGTTLFIAATIVMVRWMSALWTYRNTGFDPTDEGYYLAAVTFPDAIAHGPTDFAYYLRPVWLLSGQTLGHYRVVGFILLVLASTCVAVSIGCLFEQRKKRLLVSVLLVPLISSISLYQYILWIPTPNYNHLNLTLMLFFVALFIWQCSSSFAGRTDPLGWLRHSLVGLLIVMIFATRATAAVGAALVFVVTTAFLGNSTPIRHFIRHIAGGVALGLVVHSLVTTSWPWATIRRWSTALELSALRRDHPASKLWETDFLKSDVLPWLWIPMCLVVGTVILRRTVRNAGWRLAVLWVACAGLVAVMWPHRPGGGLLITVDGASWWWWRLFIYAFILSALVVDRRDKYLLIGPAVALLAVVSSAGSANGIFRQIVFTSAIALSGLLLHLVMMISRDLTTSVRTVPHLLLLAMAVSVSGAGLGEALDLPYRTGPYRADAPSLQQMVDPLGDSTTPVDYGPFGTINVHPDSAKFVKWVAEVGSNLPNGITCVVNLEGGTPIIAPLLGIPPAASLWEIGAYPGSDAGAAQALENAPCWRSGPFVLIDSMDGDRRIAVPAELAGLCDPPFTTFNMNLAHKATIRASLCRP